MSRKKLSTEEEALVNSIVKRKVRYLVLAEQHAKVVRPLGREIFDRAHAQASRALAPKTGKEIMYPPRGTKMDEYYQKFEPALTANAQTPYEHLYIYILAMGLNSVVNACEYGYLPERVQWEVDIGMRKATEESFKILNRDAITGSLTQTTIQRLSVLPQIDPNARLIQLQPGQVNDFLGNFSKLHHKVLWDADSCECYKIIGANYSQETPTIVSYEVQLQECPSAVTYQFNEVKQMLLRSSVVVT